MGALLLVACTITLIIVVYIVYFKQKQMYPYPYSFYPQCQYPNEYFNRPKVPQSAAKDYYRNTPQYNYNYLNNTNLKSPNSNFDYSIKAKVLQSPGYLLKKYTTDTAAKENLSPESLHQIKYQNIDYSNTNKNFGINQSSNYRIINAGDYLSQYNQLGSTNNKNVVLKTPASTSAFKSIFKPQSSNGNNLYIENSSKNVKETEEEAKSIIKKLEFTDAFTSNKKNI